MKLPIKKKLLPCKLSAFFLTDETGLNDLNFSASHYVLHCFISGLNIKWEK